MKANNNFNQARASQTIESYENDPILNYLIENMAELARYGKVELGLANILDVRERLYPNLFTSSIDRQNTGQTTSEITEAYLEHIRNIYGMHAN